MSVYDLAVKEKQKKAEEDARAMKARSNFNPDYDSPSTRLAKVVAADIAGIPGNILGNVGVDLIPDADKLRELWINGPSDRENILERTSELLPALAETYMLGGAGRGLKGLMKLGAAATGVNELTGSSGLAKTLISAASSANQFKKNAQNIPKHMMGSKIAELEKAHGISLKEVDSFYKHAQAHKNFGKILPHKGFIDSFQKTYDSASKKVNEVLHALQKRGDKRRILVPKVKGGKIASKRALFRPIVREIEESMAGGVEKANLLNDINKIIQSKEPLTTGTLMKFDSLIFGHHAKSPKVNKTAMGLISKKVRGLIGNYGGETGREYLDTMKMKAGIHESFEKVMENGPTTLANASAYTETGKMFVIVNAVNDLASGNILRGISKIGMATGMGSASMKPLIKHALDPERSPMHGLFQLYNTMVNGSKISKRQAIKDIAKGGLSFF